MENKKTKIISIASIIALALTLVSATFAYFMSQTGEGKSTDIKINASTVDTFTFETGSTIDLNINQDNFASGAGNQSGTTYAKAILTANNKTNTATDNYNLFLNISDNSFGYTKNSSYPEILLTIKDSSNNEITSISGLEYKTVTDGKGASISGFDVTTKTGLITLLNNREITTTSSITEQWNITVAFINYNADQSKNAGKSFSAQILISKDTFENYTPNTINTLSATKSGSNLTVNLSVENGSNEIDKYYYAIEEKSSIAYNTNALSIKRLANASTQALSYVESTSSSYTFTNIDSSKNYVISAYAMDKNKIKTNTYEYNYYSGSYGYPVINKVETTSTSSSITAKVTATKGTNNISKYYYSIDGGNSFIESSSNSYTFSNLAKENNYKIIIKIMDSNNKYSNNYVKKAQTISATPLSDYIISQYNNTQGNNGIYYHNSSLAGGAQDNSYRYTGTNPNNYVCFGSDATTCPEDNLYRIIGVFNNQVKLIKATIAKSNLLGTDGAYSTDTTYKWSSLISCPSSTAYNLNSEIKMLANKNQFAAVDPSEACNMWDKSDFNKINLNTNFINNIGTSWSSMIEDATWKISGFSIGELDLDAQNVFSMEIYNATKTYGSNDGTSKIGLMYVSDYGFAANPSAWPTVLINYSDFASDNWLNSGVTEWTISPVGETSNTLFALYSDGNISFGGSNTARGTRSSRPVFYLKSSVDYSSGSGTKDSPIRIGK